MSTHLSDPERQQQLDMLRASAVSFAAKESPPSRARALRAVPPGYEPRLWHAMATQGWAGLLVPEALGGHGQGLAEMAEVATALAMQVAPEPVTPVLVFAGRLLQACDANETARRLLGELAQGSLLVAVAWQEDATGAAAFDRNGQFSEPATTCVRDGDELCLRGGKRHVRPGASADGYIVSATSADGVVLVWLPADSTALTTSNQLLADGTYAAQLVFDDVKVPSRHLLADGLPAQSALACAYDDTLLITAVELLAVSRRMLAMTLDYLRTRKQFGKAIGGFQSLQHRAVDLLIQQELCAAVVAHAINEFDRGCPVLERALLAARVKARCSDAALKIARECVQLHGAIGVTDEYDLGLYLQRALVLSAWLGNSGVQRRRFAALGDPANISSEVVE